MRILHTVESYDPESHGMQQVVKQISERLFQRGHDVTIATKYHPKRKSNCINGVKIEEFHISGKAVDGYIADELEIKRYQEFLINSDFDIITNFAAQQWATDIALPILKKINTIKVFVPTGFSELRNEKYSNYFNSMKAWMLNYDMNVFLSDEYQDIEFARVNSINNTIVITNGASEEEFENAMDIDIRKKLRIPKKHFLIVHVGSHTGLKGHREAIKIFRKAKIKNASLLIIGNSIKQKGALINLSKNLVKIIFNIFSQFYGKKYFPACYISCRLKSILNKISLDRFFNNKILLSENLTRYETIAAYKEANLFLFPSNIECSPLVLFESMASKTGFLTSDTGNAKQIIQWSNSGKLLPTTKNKNGISTVEIKESVFILEELIQKGEELERMAADGYEAYKRRFTWAIISQEYEELYYSLISKV